MWNVWLKEAVRERGYRYTLKIRLPISDNFNLQKFAKYVMLIEVVFLHLRKYTN